MSMIRLVNEFLGWAQEHGAEVLAVLALVHRQATPDQPVRSYLSGREHTRSEVHSLHLLFYPMVESRSLPRPKVL